MEQMFLSIPILLEGVVPLVVIWLVVYLVVTALKGDPQIVKKFNSAYAVVLLWSVGIFLIFTIYEVLVNMLISKGFLVEKPLSDYSMPIFYITLLMVVIMFFMEIKSLEILKLVPAFRHTKKISFKYVIKYGFIGLLFGLSYSTVIFALCVFFILEIGMSALAMHPIYGDNFLFFFGVALLIAEVIIGILTGLKEGVRYGQQS